MAEKTHSSITGQVLGSNSTIYYIDFLKKWVNLSHIISISNVSIAKDDFEPYLTFNIDYILKDNPTEYFIPISEESLAEIKKDIYSMQYFDNLSEKVILTVLDEGQTLVDGLVKEWISVVNSL